MVINNKKQDSALATLYVQKRSILTAGDYRFSSNYETFWASYSNGVQLVFNKTMS